jgi:hypothetical protein
MIFIIMAIGSVAITGETDIGHINITIGSVSSYMRRAAQKSAEDTIRGTVFR